MEWTRGPLPTGRPGRLETPRTLPALTEAVRSTVADVEVFGLASRWWPELRDSVGKCAWGAALVRLPAVRDLLGAAARAIEDQDPDRCADRLRRALALLDADAAA